MLYEVITDSSLIYSWSRNLSGEMFGIFGYYLASPFSFITVILPRSMMLFALELMQLFKIGAAALAFSIYIKNSKKSRIFTTIIFSSLYALMGFSVVQLMNPMWLDGVIYLPLIILGVITSYSIHYTKLYEIKYRQDDARNILERSSARETAARGAVGSVITSYSIHYTKLYECP